MRIAVLADIHSNVLALDAVLARLAQRGPDVIVDLGDCVSGPLWPRKTLERLATLDTLIAIRGNHDRQVATVPRDALGTWDRLAAEELSEEQRTQLLARPVSQSIAPDVIAFHATPARDDLYLLEEVVGGRLVRGGREGIAARLGKVDARLVLCAHSHRPDLVGLPGGPIILNPGSVGCPAYGDGGDIMESGSPHARCAVIDVRADGQFSFELLAVPYDHEAAARRAEENGRPEWAHPLRTGFMPPRG